MSGSSIVQRPMDMDAVFIGTAGSVPTARRGLPALLLRHGSSRILFDCGEGTQRQLARSVGLVDLDAVFFTHFHADHWLGLPGLLKTFELRDRDRPFYLYGPRGLESVLDLIEDAVGSTRYELISRELDHDDHIDFDGLSVRAFNVAHRGAAFGYVISEPARAGRVDLERAAALGLQPGPDLGRLQRGEAVGNIEPSQVLGPARRGRKVVLSGDTAPCQALAMAAEACDVLIHEATFLHQDADRAAEKAHSTAVQAAQLASECGAKLLALTHLSSRYHGREVEREATEIFLNSFVAKDFDRIEIPVEGKGQPQLFREKKRNEREHRHLTSDEPGIVSDEV